MSFENRGSMTATVVVTSGSPDKSGNFVIGAADPTVVIEAAMTYLNVFGGGVLLTKGAGETWTITSTIDTQGSQLTWISDWSLKLDWTESSWPALRVNNGHDWVTLIGLHIEGTMTTMAVKRRPAFAESHIKPASLAVLALDSLSFPCRTELI